MSDFTDAQKALAEARAREQVDQSRVRKAEQIERRAAAALSRLERRGGKPIGGGPSREDLKAGLEKDKAAAAEARALLGESTAGRLRAFGDFQKLIEDPTEQITQLDASVPFVMLPLRLETRFRDRNLQGKAGHFLWVRAYPDDCAIDTFEELPSESELEALRGFWIDWWKAGGHEQLKRGAWRGLVATVGAGRASWLVGQHKPDLTTAPVKAASQDVVLVIVAAPPPVPAERDAILKYWVAVWEAEGNTVKLTAARTKLDQDVTAARSPSLLEAYVPANLTERPPPDVRNEGFVVQAAFLSLPAPPTSQQASWSQGPKTYVLPERLAVLGFVGNKRVFQELGATITSPLVIAPDPGADGADQLKLDEQGELVVPEVMKWVTHFPSAVSAGMGFVIDLDKAAEQSAVPSVNSEGLDRLMVVGVRLASDAEDGSKLFETLLTHHRDGRAGLAILAQGTPTNNTDSGGAGFSRSEEADASFDRVWGAAATPPPTGEVWTERRDAQRLADALGIDVTLFDEVSGALNRDAAEAMAMNRALWPGTLGYVMQTLMQQAFDPAAIELTRRFFSTFVTGRGLLPALRIGRQPYGVLPAAAVSRLEWKGASLSRESGLGESESSFLPRLAKILRMMSQDWRTSSHQVARVGKTGDPHQLLLEILGLHSGSVEYHQRIVEGFDDIWNRAAMFGFAPQLATALTAVDKVAAGEALLARFEVEASPDILYKVFWNGQNLLTGPVVDDVPLSETRAVRAYTDDDRNYLEWLRDELKKSVEAVRSETGFGAGAPQALLYIMLRHAALRASWDTGLQLHVSADMMTAEQAQEARREPPFIHVQAAKGNQSASPWATLYMHAPAVTGQPQQLVVEYLSEVLATARPEGQPLAEVIAGIEALIKVPTARLERAFAEHVNLCSYRLDAWVQGLLHHRLASRRFSEGLDGEARRGLYLGAYGYQEDVRPRARSLQPAEVPADLKASFTPTPMVDSTNAGHIHAPSVNHAVTAAVLRNAHISHASQGTDGIAVNLSSERVRRALAILEGIRGGQSLAALLGYQFERGLHDRHDVAEVDRFIFPLRHTFPLKANQLKATEVTDPNVPIEAIEARNVVHGLHLVDHVKSLSSRVYPFGLTLPSATAAEQTALSDEIARLLDSHDAVADLMLAEGVHQAVQSNYDGAAAALDVVGKGQFPTLPDVVRTPRSGNTLTHRVGLHLEVGIAPTAAAPPRAQVQPALNKWLAGVLPLADQIVAVVTVSGAAPTTVSLQQLQLEPIDLLYLAPADGGQAMAELDDRILRFVLTRAASPRPDKAITIKYATTVAGKVTFFELGPLLRSLRTLVLRSRPLRRADVLLHNEATAAQGDTGTINRQRLAEPLLKLKQLLADLKTFVTPRQAQLDADNRAALLAGVDATLDEAVELLARAAHFGLPQTGWGFAYAWRRATFLAILTLVNEVAERWDERLAQFVTQLAEADALPTTASIEQRSLLLQRAERLVSTVITSPTPAPAVYRPQVVGKRDQLQTKRDTLDGVLNTPVKRITDVLTAAKGILPLTSFDVQEPSFEAVENAIVRFVADVVAMLGQLASDIDKRVLDVEKCLAEHDATARADVKVRALTKAASQMFGEDLVPVPELALLPEQAAEWAAAYGAGAPDGALLEHVTNTSKRDEPVLDWLSGVARVREKLHCFEQLVLWTGAFGRTEPELRPVQLPFQPAKPPEVPGGDPIPIYHWLALEYPTSTVIDGDRLLYTAHYATPFTGGGQAGLLLDEWTEVLPAQQETTGLVFHHDRPQSEAPQALLLVTSPKVGGAWAWADVVDAISETFDAAKQRAVEPAHLDASPYARFLPATLMAVSLYEMTMSANLALNNNFYAKAVRPT